RLVRIRGAPDLTQDRLVRQEFALVLGEQPQQGVLVRGELHAFPADGDFAPLEIQPQLADLDDRVGRRLSPPQRRTETGKQLVDAERLRDVVVGAGIERRDLLALVTDDGEHDDRNARPAPKLATDVRATRVRESKVEYHRIGR